MLSITSDVILVYLEGVVINESSDSTDIFFSKCSLHSDISIRCKKLGSRKLTHLLFTNTVDFQET